MENQGEDTARRSSLGEHLKAAHNHAEDPTVLYHVRAALQHAYCDDDINE
jgi:hypothetical protein